MKKTNAIRKLKRVKIKFQGKK